MRSLLILVLAFAAGCSEIETQLVGVEGTVEAVPLPPSIPPILIDRSYIYDGVYAIEEWFSSEDPCGYVLIQNAPAGRHTDDGRGYWGRWHVVKFLSPNGTGESYVTFATVGDTLYLREDLLLRWQLTGDRAPLRLQAKGTYRGQMVLRRMRDVVDEDFTGVADWSYYRRWCTD